MKSWRRSLRIGAAAWLAGVAVLMVPLLTAAGTGVFEAHPTTPSFGTGYSRDVALGDLDGDSDLDAVVANHDDEGETAWLNDGGGNFSGHPVTPVFGAEDSERVSLGDLDGDRDLDAVVANLRGPGGTVWLNDGSGNFSAHPARPSFGEGGSADVALGDIDDDGDLDAVLANVYLSKNTVWLNDGTGNFSSHPTTPIFAADARNIDVALGDVDGDDDLDAVVINTVWLNDGAGNFSAHPAPGLAPSGDSDMAALGDMDGDGDLDAVFSADDPSSRVWLNDGTGTFTLQQMLPPYEYELAAYVTLGDLDADGDLDVVVANFGPESVWLNDGSGNLSLHPVGPEFGNGPSMGMALGDLDGDRDLDAVIADDVGQTEQVWLNGGSAPLGVQLAGFGAIGEEGHIRVTWDTMSEQENRGFNLYRGTSAEAPEQQLNETLIASEAPESSEGYSYEWVDTEVQAGTTYYYWLETVEMSGTTSRTGPVSATYEAPTAVTVGGLGASSHSILPRWAGAVGVALALAGLRLRQRRA